MESETVVKALAALAQSTRLEIFRALVVVGQPGLTPSAIAEGLQMAPATLSFHLKELVHAELVSQERSGRNLIYRARFDQMQSVIAYLTENCCQGQACMPDTALQCAC